MNIVTVGEEEFDLHTTDGQYKYIGRFLVDNGAPDEVLNCLCGLNNKASSPQLTNGDIMRILEDNAHEWSKKQPVPHTIAVCDYLNFLCYHWMGGDWGLRAEHIIRGSDQQKEIS